MWGFVDEVAHWRVLKFVYVGDKVRLLMVVQVEVGGRLLATRWRVEY